jgi:hypothetical protein
MPTYTRAYALRAHSQDALLRTNESGHSITHFTRAIMRSGSRMKKEQMQGSVVEVDVVNVPQASGEIQLR